MELHHRAPQSSRHFERETHLRHSHGILRPYKRIKASCICKYRRTRGNLCSARQRQPPIRLRPYRTAQQQRDRIAHHVEDMLDRNIEEMPWIVSYASRSLTPGPVEARYSQIERI